MMINETEVNTQILQKRRITEDKLKDETAKKQKLESQVDSLQKTVEVEILNLKLGNNSAPQHSHNQDSNNTIERKKWQRTLITLPTALQY